jgi:hypothetical protein
MRKSSKKRLHSLSKRLIVLIDLGVVDRFCGWVLMADRGQDGAEHFFAKQNQGSHGAG